MANSKNMNGKNIKSQYDSVKREVKDYKEYLLTQISLARESGDFDRAKTIKSMILKLESNIIELSKGSNDYITILMDTNITSNVVYGNKVYIDLGIEFDSQSKAKVNKFVSNLGLKPIW